jgi:uncharacterized membrane protein AbrB (regulator of aidB expression)
MFAIAVVGVRSLRKRLPRWVVVTSVVGIVASVAIVVLNAYPFVDVVSPGVFAAKIIGTTLIANAVGYFFYRSRGSNRTTASIR